MSDLNFGKIEFSYTNEGDHYIGGKKISHVINGDSTIDEVLEEFEYFLKGMGFYFKEGQHVGFEYEDEATTWDNSFKKKSDQMGIA